MASCRSSTDPIGTGGEYNPLAVGGNSLLNNTRRIAELKKKSVLAEGQKKAYTGDWTQRDKQTSDVLSELKKDIKRLTTQLVQLNNRPSIAALAASATRATTVAQQTADDAATAAASVAAKTANTVAVPYPAGARTADEAVHVYDLQRIQCVKRLDLLNARYIKRAQHFDRLYERYRELQSTVPLKLQQQSSVAVVGGSGPKNTTSDAASSSATTTASVALPAAASGTAAEQETHQRVAQLENDCQRTHVQWMEAEHIRKQYRSIGAALAADAERFERSLQRLERAQRMQDEEIERMQRTHHEALVLRDGTKVALLRQEHSVHGAARTRDRQAQECRRLVEERKQELERLERRLFATAVPTAGEPGAAGGGAGGGGGGGESAKANQQQAPNSAGGRPGSGDSQTTTAAAAAEEDAAMAAASGKSADKSASGRVLNAAERAQLQLLHRREQQFKVLMEQTGATTPAEVLQRYVAQRESSARLGYLRTVAETEKQQLEQTRETLSAELEASKFTSVKEKDENQEDVDKLKQSLRELDAQIASYATATEHSGHAIDSIQQTLLDLILKLQEVDEIIDCDLAGGAASGCADVDFELADLLSGNVDDVKLLRILEDKFRKGINWCEEHQAAAAAADAAAAAPAADSTAGGTFGLPLASPAASRPPTSMQLDERPQAFPSCYSSLMAARGVSSSVGAASTGGPGGNAGGPSVTPGQMSQAMATDDEAEVPSRGYIKRQAQSIVDAKSRRKGFRAPKR